MNLSAEQRSLLEQAPDWRLLALLFECPTSAWREHVESLIPLASDPQLCAAAEAALAEASEGLYHSSFGPGGPASPREVSYHDSVQLGYLMSELAFLYDAFAYRPISNEPPDHVALESGYVSYLAFKQAYALGRSESERAQLAADASHRFLENHLSMIAEPLAGALAGSQVRYLALAGEVLLRHVGPRRTLPVLATGGDCEEVGCEFDC
jgi:TorA maturation chaperone TorD